MKRFVSLREALDAVSAHAPRPWAKRLLLSFIMDGSLTAFATAGHLIGRVPASVLLDDDELAVVDGAKFWDAVREKWGVSAPSPDQRHAGYKYPVTGYRWYDGEPFEPHEIGYGYFKHADALDWDAGTLEIGSLFPNEADQNDFEAGNPMFLDGGNLAQPRFSWLEFEVELSGISFDRSAIELLTGMERKVERGGRPTKWDWAGAMTAVVALANKPDGIGNEPGQQALVERTLADWFVRETGEQPHISQIRTCAQRVMNALAEN